MDREQQRGLLSLPQKKDKKVELKSVFQVDFQIIGLIGCRSNKGNINVAIIIVQAYWMIIQLNLGVKNLEIMMSCITT
ncbi:hypothetical protein D3C86_1347920 [compost metagenome]